MIEDHFWTLIAKKLSGEADEEELIDFEKLLRENPDLHYPLQAITDLWYSDLQFNQQDAQDALKKHIQRMKDLDVEFHDPEEELGYETKEMAKRKWVWPTLAAAFFMGTLFFGIRFFSTSTAETKNQLKDNKQVVNQISTKNSSKTNLILSDGTKVWLNAGSSLTYDTAYNKTVREVSLTGEAFFDVTKNKTKPFIIHTSKFDIKVLGTEFNVKSYSTDRTTEASLIRGSIEVTFKDNPDRKIILKPNEKIVVNNSTGEEASNLKNNKKTSEIPDVAIKGLTHEYNTGTIIETSWVENKLIFQDESFEDISHQLERWYGVSIVFNNNQLKENHLTGNFKNETIRQALDALKLTASFKYEIDKNNNITIY
jgi:transmembrane sensor